MFPNTYPSSAARWDCLLPNMITRIIVFLLLIFNFFLERTDFTADFLTSSQDSLSSTECPDALSHNNSTEIKYSLCLWALLTLGKMMSWRHCWHLREPESQVVVGFCSGDICELVALSSFSNNIDTYRAWFIWNHTESLFAEWPARPGSPDHYRYQYDRSLVKHISAQLSGV